MNGEKGDGFGSKRKREEGGREEEGCGRQEGGGRKELKGGREEEEEGMTEEGGRREGRENLKNSFFVCEEIGVGGRSSMKGLKLSYNTWTKLATRC